MEILMIEDNHSVCEMMAMFLRKKNGTVNLLMMAWKQKKSLTLTLINGILFC